MSTSHWSADDVRRAWRQSVPLAVLERRASELLPVKDVQIVLYDNGEGLASRAVKTFQSLGYTKVALLEGGLAAWKKSGELFRDVNSYCKAFGEWVEHTRGTPTLSADEFDQRRQAGEPFLLLDARPFHEYQAMTIPGSTNCPGAELALRASSVVPDDKTPIVVNCAGRTRSLIGAQSLIDAGFPNPVYALRNGTIGWLLAGKALETGANRQVDQRKPGPVWESVRQHARRHGVAFLTTDDVHRWREESDRITTHILDVRSAEEFAAGHWPDSRHAPGGQLVQATDDYVAVRQARLLLVDDDGIRAPMSAAWLCQMGWRNVAVATLDQLDEPLQTIATAAPPSINIPQDAQPISATTLAEGLQRGDIMLVDISRSDHYRKHHVPGAKQAARSRLPYLLSPPPDNKTLVITGTDPLLAALAAAEMSALFNTSVKYLSGSNEGWRSSGFSLRNDQTDFLEPPDDVYRRPYEGTGHDPAAMQAYIDWELQLVAQLEREQVSGFYRPDTEEAYSP